MDGIGHDTILTVRVLWFVCQQVRKRVGLRERILPRAITNDYNPFSRVVIIDAVIGGSLWGLSFTFSFPAVSSNISARFLFPIGCLR